FVDRVDPPIMTWKTAPTKGQLKGFVYDSANSNGLDYATVTLTGPTNKTIHTDATGFYGAVDLPAGTYTLSFSMSGYQSASTNLAVVVGTVTNKDVYLDLSAFPAILYQPQSQTVVL